jgi:glycosyltransferase involved in cell wall biosynthesis
MFHIIIPTFNRKRVISRAINSILRQKSYNKEYINIYIIDDGSTDWTNKLINNNFNFNNVFYFYKNNWGVSSARNFWITKVLEKWNKKDYILFLDSDDTFTSKALEYINNILLEFKNINYFAFWVENNFWKKSYFNIKDNQILSYNDSLSEKKASWEFFRVLKLNILIENTLRFPDGLNWWECIFWLSVNKKYKLLVSDYIVRIYYLNEVWITRDYLDLNKVLNFLNVTKLIIDKYWRDLFYLNKKLLGIHFLVYARMLALSWERMKSFKYWCKGLFYSFNFFSIF